MVWVNIGFRIISVHYSVIVLINGVPIPRVTYNLTQLLSGAVLTGPHGRAACVCVRGGGEGSQMHLPSREDGDKTGCTHHPPPSEERGRGRERECRYYTFIRPIRCINQLLKLVNISKVVAR